jgi:YD repeat-containing protein
MKKSPACFIAFIALQLTIIGVCHGQAPSPQFHLKTAPANIVVDGDIKEWGDSLSYYSPEERLNYAIANSKDTLYLAVKIYDHSEIMRILNAGLTFSIDPKGKKKETFSLTYPLNVQGGGSSAFSHSNPGENEVVTQEERDELLRERMTSLRGIKVVGFKDIEDDMITTSNTYGIQTAVKYDEAGNLVYEEAIPLKFFHADDKTEWAFNIKINGVQRPKPTDAANGEGGGGGGRSGGGGGGGMGGGGGRHGGGGGRHGGGQSGGETNGEMGKSVDFWGKFYLAKN